MADKPSPELDNRSRIWDLVAALACATPLLLLIPHWLAACLLAASALATLIGWRWRVSIVLRAMLTFVSLGLVLLAYDFAIGRDTASAMLLAMLMLKPIELTSQRDARSLIGFGLFALFSALLLDQGPLTLILALPAAMLAFAACARLADAEVGSIGEAMDRRRLMAIVALFALATPIALAGFWLFPRLGSPLWGVPNVARGKTGISDSMAPGDWLDLMSDDSPAFRVHFQGPTPAQQSLYWRGVVLWNFDGRAWTQMNWPPGWPPAPVVPVGPPVHYEVTLEPTDKRYLFSLDLPQDPPDRSVMAEDMSILADQPVSSLYAYPVTSVAPAHFDADLDPRIRNAALLLPQGYNPRAVALAHQWRNATQDDRRIVDLALQMFHANFSYSLAAPPLGRNSVDDFLFDTKIGFCEHFSSSFTFLMRAAGIPARVVTGYVGGYRNRVGNFLLVRQSDAHAWSEVWLRGQGWTRVDPTAAVAPDHVFRHAGQDGAGAGGGTTLGKLFDVGDWMRNNWNELVLRFDAERQQLLLHSLGLPGNDKNTLVIAFALTTGALLLLIALFQLRDRGPRQDPLLRAWGRFTKRLARAHLPKHRHEPALAWSRRVAPLLPEQREQVISLSERFASARYAADVPDESTRRELVRDLLAFRITGPARS